MRTPTLPIFALACVLSGCAASDRFLVPDAGSPPSILTVHIDSISVGNPEDLRDDLDLDSTGLGDWLEPILAAELRKSTGIDSIEWDDSLATEPWTATIGRAKFHASRPADSASDGWTLVLGNGWSARSRHPGMSIDGMASSKPSLDLGFSYTLVERRTGRVLAFGRTLASSPYTFSMGRGEWEEAAGFAGRDIGRHLPRRAGASGPDRGAWQPGARKNPAANGRP